MSSVNGLVNSLAFSSSLLLSSVFLFSSCQPKDVDLRGVQSATQSAKEQKVSAMSISETNNVLALTVERAFEPLSLLKAKLDAAYAEQNDLSVLVSTKPADSDELAEEMIESKTASKDKKLNRSTNTTSALSYKVDEFSVDAGGKLRKLVLVKNVFKKTIQRALKGSDNFDSQSFAERMTIRPSVDDNIYVIKVSRSDNTNSRKDKNSLINTETKIKIIWDGQKDSLNKPLQVVHIEVDADRQLNKTGKIKIYDDQPTGLTVEVGACVSINGTVKLNTALDKDQKMTNPEQVVITDSSFQFTTKQVSKALPCETRPVVDLSRLL